MTLLTDKLTYRPGDTVVLQSGNPCKLTGEIDNESTVEGSFVASGFGGFLVTDKTTGLSSLFSVSENPLDLAIGGQAGSAGWTGGTHQQWQQLADQLVAQNVTFVELPFGPDDCVNLRWDQQPGGQGFSGQWHTPQSHANLVALVKLLQAKGITVAAYINCRPCAPCGWQWASQNKSLCRRDPFGNIDGYNSPAVFAAWNNPTDPVFSPSVPWTYINLDWSNPATIEAHIAAVLGAIDAYGFDVIRNDGLYDVPGDPTTSLGNVLQMRTALNGKALFGANFGQTLQNDVHAAACVSGGGLYLSESGGDWRTGLAVNAIGANWFNAPNGSDQSYVFPSHSQAGVGTTPAIRAWLLRWSGFLWDRSATTVTTAPLPSPQASPYPGAYVRSRRGSDGLRYDTLFFTQPGTYKLPSAADVFASPEATVKDCLTVAVKTFGIAIWKIDDRLPSGTITVRCDHGSTGYPAQLGPDGRQWRPDLSTSDDKRGPIYPFLGFASLGGELPAGTYQPVVRLWYEADPRGATIHLRIEDNGTGKDVSTMNLGAGGTPISSGWGYCDYKMPAFTLTAPGDLQGTCFAFDGSFGKLHLDSVSFVRQ